MTAMLRRLRAWWTDESRLLWDPVSDGECEPSETDSLSDWPVEREPVQRVWHQGHITQDRADYYIVDADLYWPKSIVPQMIHGPAAHAISVGWEVRLLLVQMDEHESPQVSQVSDLWPPGLAGLDAWAINPSGADLLIQDFQAQSGWAGLGQATWTQPHREMAQVHQWTARGVTLSLGPAATRYIDVRPAELGLAHTLAVGDFLVVDLTCSPGLKILSAAPLRTLSGSGDIQCYWPSDDRGLIQSDVFFNQSVCVPSYSPRRGDQVTFRAVECCPRAENKHANWRAIQVQPRGPSARRPQRLRVENWAQPGQRDLRQAILSDKQGLTVPDRVHAGMMRLEAEAALDLGVSNTGLVDQWLVSVAGTQTVGLHPHLSLPLRIGPEATTNVLLLCQARLLGRHKDLVVLTFEGPFSIGTEVQLVVGDEQIDGIMPPPTQINAQPKSTDHHSLSPGNAGFPAAQSYVPGRKSTYKPKPSFRSTKLGDYNIPRHFWAYDGKARVAELVPHCPALEQETCYANYKSKLSALLHLEELARWRQMKRYDLHAVALVPCGPYLGLEVPGLAEKQPSLVIGDSAMLRPTGGLNPGTCYEGCITEVRSKMVLLLFNQQFHVSYSGEAYDASFKFNRSTFRRQHLAIELVQADLGERVLFPSRVCLHPPQVSQTPDPGLKPTSKKKTMRVIHQKVYPSAMTNRSVDQAARSNCADAQSPQLSTPGDPTSGTPGQDSKRDKRRKSSVAQRLFGHTGLVSPNVSAELSAKEAASNPSFTLPLVNNPPRFTLRHQSVTNTCSTSQRPADLPFRFDVQPPKPVKGLYPPYCPRPRPRQTRYQFFNPSLNQEQQRAVNRILCGQARPLPYVIYGPPGTGKTVTVVESILQLFSLRSDSRILVVTPSNSSADLITERLCQFQALGKTDLARLNAFQRHADSIPEPIRAVCFSNADDAILAKVVRHRIVVSTCSTAGQLYKLRIKEGHFTHCFVDEAGHLTEPETMVPFSLVSHTRAQFILAGDPKQLGPVLQGALSKTYGLQESFLERLSHNGLYARNPDKFRDHGGYDPVLVTKLIQNYRSHEAIIAVPSKLFYDGELVARGKTSVLTRYLGLTMLPNPEVPLLFHGIKGYCCQEDDSPSWFNPVEAYQAVKYIQELYSEGVLPEDLGVIAPYRKQAEKIRRLLESLKLSIPKVGSVEEFQGQEKSVIIVTTVRCTEMDTSEVMDEQNVAHGLGFIQSEKRFNVALTRARSLLLVVGDPHLLSLDQTWFVFLSFCCRNGSYKGCDLPLSLSQPSSISQ